MGSLLIALGSLAAFLVAYHTYGRYLAGRVFDLNPSATTPAHELEDGIDYVPTRKSVVFGHHFTSIAGTGPIVGPAIAVFWGWLPALLWILLGNIFIGAVHDFGALVVSLRSRGHSIGDVAARMISRRARLVFMLVLFLVLTVVIGIFGLVIAVIFANRPDTVLAVWISMPIAIGIGFYVRKRGGSLWLISLLALVVIYGSIVIGVRYLPLSLGSLPLYAPADAVFPASFASSVVAWTLILLAYCFAASVLPVWMLLQPRDYINSQQLLVALVLLVLGLLVAQPALVAPALASKPAGAPPIFPFLFITIACGAVSGFHCLVSSGTSSKQLDSEANARYVGYGGMLLEGALAVLVVVACCAGLGLGVLRDGELLTGTAAWQQYYGGGWAKMGLAQKVGAFIDGGGNMIAALGVPADIASGIIAVMVACFAATTLDTATRLQRYVLQELGETIRFRALTNKYVATAMAVGTGGALALTPGPAGPGSGGLILWPLFGAINQLLAGIAFLVIAFYLARHKKPVWFLALPTVLMLLLPAWAMIHNIMFKYVPEQQWLLVAVGVLVEVLQVWLIVEAALMWRNARGVLPEPLPPLERPAYPVDGGRVC